MEEVNHPSHYTSHPANVECIQITEHMNFCLGNAVKYLWRAGLKTDDPIKDLKKAVWYLEREIARIEKQQTAPFFSEANGWTKGGGWDIPGSEADSDLAPTPVGVSAKDGWIEWKSGNQPVPNGVAVDVKFRGGHEYDNADASFWSWKWKEQSSPDANIIAYRVVG